MNRTIIFSPDTKSVNEGEYVTLNWECDFCPDSISLDIDNGHTFHTIQLSDKGTTKLHVSASKGRTRYTLKVKSGGKTVKKVIKIKVRNQKKTKPESKAGVGRFRLWCERQQVSWRSTATATGYNRGCRRRGRIGLGFRLGFGFRLRLRLRLTFTFRLGLRF